MNKWRSECKSTFSYIKKQLKLLTIKYYFHTRSKVSPVTKCSLWPKGCSQVHLFRLTALIIFVQLSAVMHHKSVVVGKWVLVVFLSC